MSQISTRSRGGYSPWAAHGSGPFETFFDVPVAGGALSVARAGVAPPEARGVVLALHGMTGTHMAYRTVGRELCGAGSKICLLAPDLRGRGRSACLPEPYGMAAHMSDLIAVLDQAGVGRAVVVGHSMGCNVAARLAADHPERIAAVVLLDGGLPLLPEDVIPLDEGEGEQHGIFDRFEARFASVDEYMAYWRAHPGLKGVWDEDIDAFARCDFVVGAEGVRPVANLESVRADVRDIMLDGLTWTSAVRVRPPLRLMRAERGMYDDDPLIPLDALDEFCRAHPHVSVDIVPDVNHFTLLLGGGHGPLRVAATLTELALAEHPRYSTTKR